MAERSYPTEWTTLLPAETARWVEGGLITGDQRTTILSLYPAPQPAARDRTILILTILGSLLVGAGVILFFAANWPRIPAGVKVGAILTAVVGVYAWGYHLHFRREADYPRLGHALIFLGALLYGAAIWLIAQIFHLETNPANGFLLWGLGALPVAWAVGSVPVLWLSTSVLIIWTATAQVAPDSYNYAFPLVILVGVLPLARRLSSALAEAGVLGGLFLWFLINVMRGAAALGGNTEFFLISRSALLAGGAFLAGGLAGAGDQRAWLGAGAFLSMLGAYMLTFKVGPVAAVPALAAGPAFQVAGVSLLAAATLGATGWYWRQGEPERTAVAAAVLLPGLAAMLGHLPAEVPRMVLFNLLLFGLTLGCTVLGIRRRNGLLVNLGLGVFVVHVLTRYFDLFFSAMNKSLFFVVGGVLLLGGGWWLERNRRRWMNGGDRRDA